MQCFDNLYSKKKSSSLIFLKHHFYFTDISLYCTGKNVIKIYISCFRIEKIKEGKIVYLVIEYTCNG